MSGANKIINYITSKRDKAKHKLKRIRAICEDGERSGADRLDEIYAIVTGEQ